MAHVDSLMTQVARDFQTILNTVPAVDGPGRFKRHGFVTLSWLAAMSGKTIDLRDGEHKIMRRMKNGPKELNIASYVEAPSNTKDEVYLEYTHGQKTYRLERLVWKNGTVREGLFDEGDYGYGRLMLHSSRIRIGQLLGRNLHGRGCEIFPNEEEKRGKYHKGDFK